MKLSEMAGDDPGVCIKLGDLIKECDITPDQAKLVFFWLVDNVFAKGNWIADGEKPKGEKSNLQITIRGVDEAERLRTPFWKNKNLYLPFIGALIAMTGKDILDKVISHFFK